MVDGTELDSDLFTNFEFWMPKKFMVIHSDDVDKVGLYEFLVTAFYADKPQTKVSTTFWIDVVEGTQTTSAENSNVQIITEDNQL